MAEMVVVPYDSTAAGVVSGGSLVTQDQGTGSTQHPESQLW